MPFIGCLILSRLMSRAGWLSNWDLVSGKMSESINDGGPAFPVPDTYHPNGQVQFGSSGMSLRDWLAGEAMKGLLVSDPDLSYEQTADAAYKQADAMLVERVKGGAK